MVLLTLLPAATRCLSVPADVIPDEVNATLSHRRDLPLDYPLPPPCRRAFPPDYPPPRAPCPAAVKKADDSEDEATAGSRRILEAALAESRARLQSHMRQIGYPPSLQQLYVSNKKPDSSDDSSGGKGKGHTKFLKKLILQSRPWGNPARKDLPPGYPPPPRPNEAGSRCVCLKKSTRARARVLSFKHPQRMMMVLFIALL